MAAPVREGSAAVVIPVPVLEVSPLRCVITLGCRALVKVPIQFRRHGLCGKRAPVAGLRQADHYTPQFADLAGFYQVDREAEDRLAALLRAGLQDTFRLLRRAHK